MYLMIFRFIIELLFDNGVFLFILFFAYMATDTTTYKSKLVYFNLRPNNTIVIFMELIINFKI